MVRTWLAALGVAALAAASCAALYAKGRAAGRAEIEARVAADTETRRRAADAALAKTEARVAELEGERDDLQNAMRRLDALVSVDRTRDRACLDPRLVRALDALGRGGDYGELRPRP